MEKHISAYTKRVGFNKPRYYRGRQRNIMNSMTIRLQNESCRLTADHRGLKALHAADGEHHLIWTTLSEYSLHLKMAQGELILNSGDADFQDISSEKAWIRRYIHSLVTVDVSYTLTETATLKTVSVRAHSPLTLCYAYMEVASVTRTLERGGEGQPIFVGTDGFISSTFPAAENRADGRQLCLCQAPFVSLKSGEVFTFPSVVFGLNTEGDMAESFLRFLRPRRPNPTDRLRVYCDWGAHDESDDSTAPPLDEQMAYRLLADLCRVKEQTGLAFDYYLMDDYWYSTNEPYTAFDNTHWPNGPEAFIQAVEKSDMHFGLWFDVNMGKLDDGCKIVTRGGTPELFCMGYRENMERLFHGVEYQIRENHVRLLKFDFAFFDCNDTSHTFHSARHTASKEPAVRLFIEHLAKLRAQYPDLRVLAYNGFTTDLCFISSVDPNRSGLAVSPFWAETIDYVYCGDPRPAEMPAPLQKSLLHYTDCMMEQFRDALFPTEAIDDHGTMVGNTGTIYYLGRKALRDSYILNIVRGTRKRHLYGETAVLTKEDWAFMAATEPIFDFVCTPSCNTMPILQRPSERGLYGYSNTNGDRGIITVVNTGAVPLSAVVNLPCWQEGERLSWRLLYHAGEWVSKTLPEAGILATEVEPFGVDVYGWERQCRPIDTGYVNVDVGCQVELPLPADCRRVGLRFLGENFSPMRTCNGVRSDLRVAAQGGELALSDNVFVWSGISYAVYHIETEGPRVSLLFTNTGDQPLIVGWQKIPAESNEVNRK